MKFPNEAIHAIGFTLMRVQYGDTPPEVKPLRGFGGAGVLEVIEDEDGGAFRVVYTVKFKGRVYVLHAFQKKSKHGIATPKHEIDLVKARLGWAAELQRQWERQNAKEIGRD
jgi:phage-related protein